MAKPGRYQQIVEGEWTPVDRRGNREQCCDCALVHRLDYRIRHTASGRIKFEERVSRDDRATTAIRRRAGIRIIKRRK